jgi:hypothetical protein
LVPVFRAGYGIVSTKVSGFHPVPVRNSTLFELVNTNEQLLPGEPSGFGIPNRTKSMVPVVHGASITSIIKYFPGMKHGGLFNIVRADGKL